MENTKFFMLSSSKPSKTFQISYPFSYVYLSKAVLISHFGKENWFDVIHKLQIKITFINDHAKTTQSFFLSLPSFISSSTINPVFEIHQKLPHIHSLNPMSEGSHRNFINKVIFELETEEPCTIQFFYNDMVGLK